ncbi:MAG: hypothetical protein J5604_05145 [Bacteroidales bacterium]|nr:hypothetical protein [Bacteroidales bacterium]
MKSKFYLIVILLLFGTTVSAQYNRESLSFIGLNYGSSFLQKERESVGDYKKWSPSISIELGGHWYLNHNKSIFIDGSILGFISEGHRGYTWGSSYSGTYKWYFTHLPEEKGIGVSAISGYEILIKKKLSLDLFTGFQFRQSIKRDGLNVLRKDYLWKSGIGLNYGRLRINAGFYQSLIDRRSNTLINGSCKEFRPYHTSMIYVGAAFRFSFRRGFLGLD